MISSTPYQRLGSRTLFLMMFERVLPLVVILILIPFSVFFIPESDGAAVFIGGSFLLVFIITIIVTLVVWLEYINYTYGIDDHYFSIKRGILHIEEFSIPYNKIQNVEIERPLWYRFFGVSRLIITTAGRVDPHDSDEHSEGVLEPLEKYLAKEIQEKLLEHSNIQRVIDHA